jgi:RNA polymerase sigma-70 factor (ECF subfamily)
MSEVIAHSAQAAGTDRLRQAYVSHADGLLRLCILVSGKEDVAEELVQETFLRAASALERLSEDEVRPYLRATSMNLWRNRLRRLALERRVRPVKQPDPEVPFEDRDELWSAIRQLPPRQRACLVLRYHEDLTERQTAVLLHCSIGTVKSQTSRALASLRKELRDAD